MNPEILDRLPPHDKQAEIKMEWDAGTTTFRNNEPSTSWNPNWSIEQ